MVTIRKDILTNDHYYHIYSRSIAKYTIFNNEHEYNRMLELIDLCRFKDFNYRFSKLKSLLPQNQAEIIDSIKSLSNATVGIIAFCIMPTHIHLILKQITENGITEFMRKVLDSYSKFFNTRHNRSGPLWVGHFKNVLISTNEQLLHATRYLHLNPTSAGLVEKPEDWKFSSYSEYIHPPIERIETICTKSDLFDITPARYKKFVDDQQAYQRSLAIIKHLLIDNYTG